MPEDSPGAFALYVDWLYRGTIPMANTESYVKHLYELYFLADKLCLTDLKDRTMDTIQDIAVKYDLMDELIKPALVTAVIQHAPKKTVGLHKFCINQMVFVYLHRWNEVDGDDDQSDYEYESDNEVVDDLEFPRILRRDIKSIFQICNQVNDHRFLNSFMTRFSRQVHDGVDPDNLEASDPRKRDEEDIGDRCFFHCHGKSINCRPSDDQPEDSFIRDEEQEDTASSKK